MTESKLQLPKQRGAKLRIAHDLLIMFIGVVSYAFGWTAFILSQNITSGGLAGVTTIIQLATNIPATVPYYIINVFLLVLAILFLGWRFTLNTLIGVGMILLVLPFGQALFTDPVEQAEVLNNISPFIRNLVPNVGPLLAHDEPFAALLLGSVFCGLGLGFVFSVNGSTGGTDVIVAIINKYKNVSLGRAMIMVDSVIVGTGCIVSHYMGPQYDWTVAFGKLAFSFVEIVVVAQAMDFYLNSNKQSVQFFISSLKYSEINEAIVHRLHRGCTILEATGGYSQQPTKVLMVVMRKNMRTPLMQIVREIDPNAFVSEGIVHGVYGEGFDAIRKQK